MKNKNISDIITEQKKNITRYTMSRLDCIPSVRKEGAVSLFMDMISDWRSGKYKLISVSTILTLIGSVVYVIFPYDVMPDAMGIVGLLDDFIVIAYAIRTAYEELCAYKLWLATRDLPYKEAEEIIEKAVSVNEENI